MQSASRILDCGHCSCQECLNHTLKYKDRCPFCLYAAALATTQGSHRYHSTMSRKGKALASTGAIPRKISSQTRMKKSSSVADLEVWHGEVRERRYSDGMEKPIKCIEEGRFATRRTVKHRTFIEEGVKYYQEQQTVEFPDGFSGEKLGETVRNYALRGVENLLCCNTVNAVFDVAKKPVMRAKTDSGFHIDEDLVADEMSDSSLEVGESLAPWKPTDKRVQVQEGLLEPTKPVGAGANNGLPNSRNDREYNLDPTDLIQFEELDPDNHDSEESEMSALESVFRLHSQLSGSSSSVQGETSTGNNGGPLLIDEDNASGQCPDHSLPYSFVCLTCNVWGCPSCSEDDHREDALASCFIVHTQEGVRVLKLTFKDTARKLMKDAMRIKKMVCREASAAKTVFDHYEKRAADMRRELTVVENNMSELRKILMTEDEVKVDARTVITTLKDTYARIRRSDNCGDLISAMNSLSTCSSILDQYSGKNPQIVTVMPNILLDKKEEIISLLIEGAPVYGMQERNGTKQYAQLSLGDEGILVHCLREDVYPNDGVAILAHQFDSLSAMLPQESPAIFLDIGWAGENRGRVYVKLFGTTPRSRQAILLCSGEKGHSYRNTSFYEHQVTSSRWSAKRHAILYGGDYEENDGSGGKAILENILDGEEYTHPAEEGLMVSWPAADYWRAGSFGFYLTADTAKTVDTAFGVVSRRLGILKAAAEQDPVTNAYVSDCGFVIPF
ncbi:uncharacterized protein LOC135212951 isoform X2 [Macrobrachium nipponense]